MPIPELIICTNLELVANAVQHDSPEVRVAVAEMAVDSLWQAVTSTVPQYVQVNCKAHYREWCGGKYAQPGQSAGLLAWGVGTPQEVIDKAHAAIHAELARLLALELCGRSDPELKELTDAEIAAGLGEE
jgi:hypothetical protein